MNDYIKVLRLKAKITLERGKSLTNPEIAYHTYGSLNPKGDNVIWICHALTANSDVADWWEGLVGKGKLWDPEKHFIVCANIIGSCYGSTGPSDINPDTGNPYLLDFPKITIRDMVGFHEHLRVQLGISEINTLIGGSIGGQQAMEWAVMNPGIFKKLILIATGAVATPWVIALNQSQRLAISADQSFFQADVRGGAKGLKAARSMALISYRNYKTYNRTQAEDDLEKTEHFKAASYQDYQGEKLMKRFNAHSYYRITEAFDSHNLGRGRGSLERALSMIEAKTLCVGISSDKLFPPEELKLMVSFIQGSKYVEIDSDYGHDGFLIESKQLEQLIESFNEEVFEKENLMQTLDYIKD